MRMRARTRDGRSFPVPMHKMDDPPNGDASSHSDTQKQHIFLFLGGKMVLYLTLTDENKSSPGLQT